MAVRGQVKWFDPKKGYGFIVGPQEQDVFVHYRQITGDDFRLLRDGEMVQYELVEGDKGYQARDVQRFNQGYSNARIGMTAGGDAQDGGGEDGEDATAVGESDDHAGFEARVEAGIKTGE